MSTSTVEIPRTAAPSATYKKFERRVALGAVIIPFVGLILVVAMLWGRGVGLMEVGLLVCAYALSIVGISVGYHRFFSHRSFQTKAPIRILLAILGSMAAQGPVLYWAAIHRHHHKFSDRPGDPHSPHLRREEDGSLLRGLWHAHTGWLFDHQVTNWAYYTPDLLRDRAIFKINQLYFLWVLLGLALPALAGGILSGTWAGAFSGFLWGGLLRVHLGQHVTWSINSICHVYGQTPFRSNDHSKNNIWLALVTFGESWHNNHHTFPASALHGLTWWQLDLSGLVIRLLKVTGLAWEVKIPSASMIEKAKIR